MPVAAYGTPDWPAFYTPTSGFKVKTAFFFLPLVHALKSLLSQAPMQLDGARQVAETISELSRS